MADNDIYDIMPHKEIAELKKQLHEIKSDKASSPELTKSMASLTKSMDSMLHLFSEAAEELKLDEKEESDLAKKLDPINSKLDQLMEQNQTIAESIVAVSDMIKEFMDAKEQTEEVKTTTYQTVQQPAFQSPPSFGPTSGGMPEMSGPPGAVPSAVGAPPQEPSAGIPFPEIEKDLEPQKKGIFGRLKKK